jgi:phosphatidylglycerol:prolipoprotein diacylglycerol transferase
MHPVLFRIPGLDLPVHTYGVMIVSGFLLAMYVGWSIAKRQGRFAEDVLDFGFWALVGGMIGARLVFIAVNSETYFKTRVFDTVDVPYFIAFFNGPSTGLATLVGLIGAAGAGFYAFKRGLGWGTRIFYALIGLAVGRAVFAVFHPDLTPSMKVQEEWLNILIVWRGGLVFYGAALGGVAAFVAFCWARKINFVDSLHFADICVLGLPLAHVLGRFGCVAAGCCWGDAAFHFNDAGEAIKDIPLALQFPTDALAYQSLVASSSPEVVEYMQTSGHTVPLIPVQLMESFGEGLVFALLLFVRQRKWFHGQVILSYFILYPILRSTLETLRGDTERGYVIEGLLSTSQFISLVVAIVSLSLIVFFRKKAMEAGHASVAAEAA